MTNLHATLRFGRSLLGTVAAILLVAPVLNAGEIWPGFRGPTADGHADDTGLPVTWSEAENIAWKTPIHGLGWSCPSIWGERIWVTTANEEGTELSYLILDRDSGQILRDEVLFTVAHPRFRHKFNTYASPTPFLEADRAYLSWGSYGLACVDSDTYDVLWVRRDLECDDYRGPGASPVIYGDTLYSIYDGFDYQFVIALDKWTGDTIWRTDRPADFHTDNGDQKKAYATPIVIDAAGRRQLICPTSKGAFSYDADTGQEIWRINYSGFSGSCRPLYEQGRVIITAGFNAAEVFSIDPSGRGDVTDSHIVWRSTKSIPSKPSPLFIDGLLYLFEDKGIATCLDAMTGESIWRERLGGNYTSSPVYADGRIFVFNEEGDATVLKPGREPDIVARNKLDDGCLASPVVADGALFVRTRTHLYRIDASTVVR
ncbi:MAG: PQQ-binding-like beta-propeller repeat protein [Planctomycetaceae bacterium]|nr:PQQ-binding-like beta-propeller repeat protein [Planctomycetaceae bacterium]